MSTLKPRPPMPRRPGNNPISFKAQSSAGGLTRDQRLLLTMAVISLVIHLSVAISMGNKPMGYIDPALLDAQRDFIRVKRVDQQDELIDDQAAEDEIADQQQKPDLAELSKSLLEEDQAPMGEPEPPAEQRIDLRQMSDQRLSDLLDHLRSRAPAVELPETVRRNIEPTLDIGVVATGGGGGGESGGGGTGVSSAELTAAQRLLAETRLIAGAGLIPQSTEKPKVTDRRRSITDRRIVDAPLNAPDIDFVGLALKGTTRMSLPEHLDSDFEYELSVHHRRVKTGFLGMGGSERLADEPAYFRLDVRPKRSLRRLQTMPKDIVFLIDTSGSIPQDWVNQILSGVRDGLSALNPGDRFNVVFFAEQATFFNPDQLEPYNPQTLTAAQQFLRDQKSKGFTDVNRAMSRMLRRDLSAQRVYYLVLISDGKPTKGVTATRDLINLITRDNDLAASIYCVGVGPQQDRVLLDFLAYRNKGYCLFADQIGDAARQIRMMVSRIRYPIMKNIRPDIIGLNVDEIFPRDLPNIHQGETFSMFGRFTREKEFTLRLIGDNGRGLLDFTVNRELTNAPKGDEQMMQDWAFWKLHELYNDEIRHGESKALRNEIRALQRKYKLKTIYDR